MVEYTEARGEIGTATICQVRTPANPLGELWHVERTYAGDRWGESLYHGADAEAAQAAYEAARRDIWA